MNAIVETAFKDFGWFQQIPSEIENLVELLSEMQIKNFVEIGTFYGGTFFILASLADKTGRHISIDLPPLHAISEIQITERNFKLLHVNPAAFLLRLDSHSEDTVAMVSSILRGVLLDVLFIDGDHSYPGVKADFENYKGFVRKGGAIVFHDIVDSENHRNQNCLVADFWKELEGNKLEFVEPGNDWGGIGVLLV